jgi:hypothetical protein
MKRRNRSAWRYGREQPILALCVMPIESGTTIMLRSVPAVVEKDGSLRLLETIEIRPGERAIVTFLDEEDTREPAVLAERSLAADWDRPEEDEAWRHLQR